MTSFTPRTLLAAGIVIFVALYIDSPFSEPVSHANALSASETASGSLSISVTDGKDSILKGGALMYAVTLVQNIQPEITTDVVLHMPLYASTVTPENGGRTDGRTITWEDVTLPQNKTVTLNALMNVESNVPVGTMLSARVEAGGNEATDVTLITEAGVSDPVDALDVYVTDNQDTVMPGGTLQYTAVVRNISSVRQIADVIITVSPLTEITDIQPQTDYRSTTLTWKGTVLAAGEIKTWTFNGIVRRSASDNARIEVQLAAGSAKTQDVTVVQRDQKEASYSSAASAQASSEHSELGRYALFRKSADTAEVLPGSMITYSLNVQNVLLNIIDDATIIDRYDPSLMQVADAGGADSVNPGQLVWKLPKLLPGETWQRSYTLMVSEDVPHGTIVSNIASITGGDVEYATLNEKVTVVRAGVVDSLPSTGASLDTLFVAMTVLTAVGMTALQYTGRLVR